MNGRKPSAFRRATPVAWLLAGGYLVFGIGWVLFSDQLGALFFTTSEALTRFQTWKGAGFVLFSALILLLAINGPAAHPERTAAAPDGVRRGPSIVFLLSMLVLATALPMVALLAWSVARESQATTANAERLVARVADSTAAELDNFIDGQMRTAAALAWRPDVRRLAPTACDAMQDTVAVLDGVQEVSVFDTMGRAICGGSARDAPPAWLKETLDTKAPVAGPLEHTASGWTFGITQPVLDEDGRIVGALELQHSAAALSIRIDAPLPEGGALTLLDQRHAILARWPSHDGFVGQVLRDTLRLQASQAQGQAAYTGRGPDGIVRRYAPRLVGTTGWTVAAGVPVEQLFAPARESLLRSLGVALVMLALCSWLVLRLTRTITQPLRALERTAQAAAAGDFGGRAPQAGPAELAAVAAGVNHMLDRLPELQREVRESAERTAQLVNRLSRHVPSMIFVYRLPDAGGGSFPFTSEAIAQVLELRPGDVSETSIPAFDRVHPEDRPRLLEMLRVSVADHAPFRLGFRVVLPQRGVRHILAQAQAERVEDAAIWYGSMTDVTELHASQQALQLMNETLEHRIAERTAALAAANAALEAFAYSVAHDLRAPLHSIEGFGQGVLHALDLGDPARARGFVARVMASAQRMNLLIDGFLALARASRGENVDAQVDLQRMVEEVLADLPRVAASRVEVAPLPRVIAEPASLRQVWHNLLENAFKYSANAPQPLVRVSWALDGPNAVFSVADNGAGFDPHYAHKLFHPFSRLHKPQEFEGTGVGLAIVRRIVERHGGRVSAHSSPGEGAVFSFTLPAERVLARGETALSPEP